MSECCTFAYIRFVAKDQQFNNVSVCYSLSDAEMSGTSADISQVHWKQQWLENGTLFFHVSMSNPEQLALATQPTVREPAQGLHEHMHLLHISVMVSECPWNLSFQLGSAL